MHAGEALLHQADGIENRRAVLGTGADGDHAGIDDEVVRIEALVREPVHQPGGGVGAILDARGRPGRAHAQRDHSGAMLLQDRDQGLQPRRLVRDRVHHRPLFAQRQR